MPFEYTVLVLLIIGALLMVVGAAWGPETKDVDFSEGVQEKPARAGDQRSRTSPDEPSTTPSADRTAGAS
jgi:hypothetical protein